MALSGKNDHVRQYKLSSIRHLILYLSGTSMAKIKAGSVEGLRPLIQDRSKNEAEQVGKWAGDYVKMLNTKDSKQFILQKTDFSIFMGVLFKQDIILFEWARDPYLKFMKLKGFWLPEGPKFMNFLHDGMGVCEVVLGYSTEANLVNVEDSKVKEIKINKDFLIKTQGQSKSRWQTFTQLPITDAKKNFDNSLSQGQAGRATFGRKVMTQTMGRKGVLANRFFLGTYHRHTRLVDITGQVVTGAGAGGWKDGVMWYEPPNDLIQRPGDYVIGIGKHTIEIIDWKTARTLQSLSFDESVNLRTVMDKPGIILVVAEKKKLGSVLFLIQEKESQIKFYNPIHSPETNQLIAFNASGTSLGISSTYDDSASEIVDESVSSYNSSTTGHSLTRAARKDSRLEAVRKTLTRISEASGSFVHDSTSKIHIPAEQGLRPLESVKARPRSALLVSSLPRNSGEVFIDSLESTQFPTHSMEKVSKSLDKFITKVADKNTGDENSDGVGKVKNSVHKTLTQSHDEIVL